MTQDTARDIRAVCNEIAELLTKKNESYGDSALNPLNCFAKDATVLEKLGVRIDDKLSRVLRGTEAFNEDTELDLLGYLVLRRIYLMRVRVSHAASALDQQTPVPITNNEGPLVPDAMEHAPQPPMHASAASHTNKTAKDLLDAEAQMRRMNSPKPIVQ